MSSHICHKCSNSGCVLCQVLGSGSTSDPAISSIICGKTRVHASSCFPII
jgi:hypothetical protein